MQTSKGIESYKDKIVLTVVGFVLTGILGSGLTFWFNYLQWRYTDKQRIKEVNATEARDVMLKTMDLCQQRFYASQRVIWAAESPVYYDLQQVQKEYLEAVKQWNMQIRSTQISLGEYLGSNSASLLVDDLTLRGKPGGDSVHTEFLKFHTSALASLRSNGKTSEGDYSNMVATLKGVGENLDSLYKEMLRRYQDARQR